MRSLLKDRQRGLNLTRETALNQGNKRHQHTLQKICLTTEPTWDLKAHNAPIQPNIRDAKKNDCQL